MPPKLYYCTPLGNMNMKKLFLLAAVLAALGSSLADRAMAQTFTILHSFAGFEVNGDGSDPVAGLIQSGATLYGTASAGGVAGLGTEIGRASCRERV